MPLRAVATALLAYFALYAPQPLLPRLAATLSVTESQIALLMSATLLPLGIAPLAYGVLLARVPAARVLRFGVAGLGVAAVVFALVPSFPVMLGARLVQGLLLPAVLTALMTALAGNASAEGLQRVMSLYVAVTILGGFGGRLLAGSVATWWDWHAFFIALGAALVVTAMSWPRAAGASLESRERPSPAVLRALWRQHGHGYLFTAIFCLFFVFVGLLNYLPFRATALAPDATELQISLLYAGYLMGIASALGAPRLIRLLGGHQHALIGGFSVYILALAGTLIASRLALFAAVFVFCGGMFLVHAIASAQVNRAAGAHRGLVNGLYVSSYYLGGVAGSYLPGLVYERWGWAPTVGSLAAVGVAGLAFTARYTVLSRRD